MHWTSRCRVFPVPAGIKPRRQPDRPAPLHQAGHRLVDRAVAPDQTEAVVSGQVQRLRDPRGVPGILGHVYVQLRPGAGKDRPDLFEDCQPLPRPAAGIHDDGKSLARHWQSSFAAHRTSLPTELRGELIRAPHFASRPPASKTTKGKLRANAITLGTNITTAVFQSGPP